MPGRANKHPIYQPCWAPVAGVGELPVLRRPAVLATVIMQRAKGFTWHKRRWSVALAAVATVLVLTWLALSDRRPASPVVSSVLRRSAALEQQLSFPPVKAVPAKGTSMVQPVPVPVNEARTARTMIQRARLGKNQVVHIGDDVTVRYFTLKPAPQRVRVGESLVVHIGDDVIVRYFTPKPAPRRVRVGESRVVHIGDDVTVRYFTPNLALVSPKPAP